MTVLSGSNSWRSDQRPQRLRVMAVLAVLSIAIVTALILSLD